MSGMVTGHAKTGEWPERYKVAKRRGCKPRDAGGFEKLKNGRMWILPRSLQ